MATSNPSNSVWHGHRVRLRPVEPDDWPLFAEWGRDDRVSQASEHVTFPQSRETVRRWTERAATEGPSDDRFRWVIVDRDDEPVGTINTHSCDRRVGSFSYGIAIAPGAQGQGCGGEAVRLVLRYFFQELGYQKATAHVYAYNDASRLLHERLGFVHEGRLRRMAYTAGCHWDVLVYGLTREEFAAAQAGKLPDFPAPDATGG